MSETKLTFPTIHLNGTAAVDLIEGYRKAHNALMDAISALAQSAPNGRDYYVQPTGAIQRAQAEHFSRIDRLKAIDDEITAIWEDVNRQENERQERRSSVWKR